MQLDGDRGKKPGFCPTCGQATIDSRKPKFVIPCDMYVNQEEFARMVRNALLKAQKRNGGADLR
jgi:hypothetical protein